MIIIKFFEVKIENNFISFDIIFDNEQEKIVINTKTYYLYMNNIYILKNKELWSQKIKSYCSYFLRYYLFRTNWKNNI